MRHVTAIAVSALLTCLALAGSGDAQTVQTIQVQGTIQSADCQTGQLTLATAGGSDTFQATDQTAVYVNGRAVSFCSLQSYTGDSTTAALIPAGAAFGLSQINVTAPASQSPAPSPSTSGSLLSSPIAVGIGALLLGGLIGYVVGHQNAPAQPAYTPVYYPANSAPVYYPAGSGPVYYPAGYAPAYLPVQYPYNRAYIYQGHRYYRCSQGGWSRDQDCTHVHER